MQEDFNIILLGVIFDPKEKKILIGKAIGRTGKTINNLARTIAPVDPARTGVRPVRELNNRETGRRSFSPISAISSPPRSSRLQG